MADTIKIVGSGGLGDSAILAAKLLNLEVALPRTATIDYVHLESDKLLKYKEPLHEFWGLIAKYFYKIGRKFNHHIAFYPHGAFWQVVPRQVYNTALGLTTKVDALVAPIPPLFTRPANNDNVVIVTDGGMGTRGIDLKVAQLIADYYNTHVLLVGANKIDEPNHLKISNLSGKICLAEAIKFILGAKLVIAPDGILGYIAFLWNVPNIIIFHELQLINQYWADGMRTSVALFHPGRLTDGRKLIKEVDKLCVL
ncbi:MAG: hypothetical protein DRI44_09130 [Chlamydiae bacterium]|nr:MAG: hypothetical protein DRI44_09130 [Chlamydiota bacterium]